MNDFPLVSVIIPTYNRADMVGNAIKSVLNQSYANIELIVVDDGSTDETGTLIQNFTEVRYILKSNGGQASARNAGLKEAKGKYIASLDSDDLWEETFLEKMVSKLENDCLDFVFSNWSQQNTDGNYEDFISQYISLRPYLPKDKNSWVNLEYKDLRYIYIDGCPSPSSSLLIRASKLKTGWNEQMNIADDWCMLLDIVLNKDTKVAFTTEQLWKKHIDCDNIFDGRDRLEVIKLLHIEDMSVIIKRYKHILNPEEIQKLKKEHIVNLMIASKHTLLDKRGFKNSLSFVFRALVEHPTFAPQIVTQIVTSKFKNRKQQNR